MRHVDDGALHAWLESQVTDPSEAAWMKQHLRECAACSRRLDEERVTLQQADTLLGDLAPAADATRLAFESLVARAAEQTAAEDRTRPRGWRRPWLMPASWAASVAVAAIAGWMVRDRASVPLPPAPSSVAAPARPQSPPSTSNATATETAPLAAADGIPSPPAPASRAARAQPADSGQAGSRATSRPARAVRSEAPAPPSPTPSSEQASVATGISAPQASPDAAVQSTQVVELSSSTRPLRSLFGVAGPDRPNSVPTFTGAAPLQTPQTTEVSSPRAQVGTLAQGLAPAVTYPAPAVSDGGGGQGRAGQGSAGQGSAAQGSAAQGGAGRGGGRAGGGAGGGRGGRAPAPLQGESATVQGTAPPVGLGTRAATQIVADAARAGANESAPPVESIVWQELPRTEAAVRSGMPLFGIDGMIPESTMLSADTSMVRTTYRLESGERVDLVQRNRARPALASAFASAPPPPAPASAGAGEPATVDVERARAASRPWWSEARGDVALTVFGGPNPGALGARLRLD